MFWAMPVTSTPVPTTIGSQMRLMPIAGGLARKAAAVASLSKGLCRSRRSAAVGTPLSRPGRVIFP